MLRNKSLGRETLQQGAFRGERGVPGSSDVIRLQSSACDSAI